MKKADYLTHITDRRNRNLKFFSLFVSSMDMRCMRFTGLRYYQAVVGKPR